MVFIVILLIILGIVFLVWSLKFKNNVTLKKENIDSLKSDVRVVKAKYLNVLGKTIDTHESVNSSQGSAYREANSNGAGTFIGGARGSIDNFDRASQIVYNLANEYQRAQGSLNYAIKQYNTYISLFPNSILTHMFHYEKEEYIDSENLNLSTDLNGFNENDL